jgi:hypothetical protein
MKIFRLEPEATVTNHGDTETQHARLEECILSVSLSLCGCDQLAGGLYVVDVSTVNLR